jgi:hypothetical protein
MFENMAAPVGFAMHEDRLATASRNLRVIEAEQGAKQKRVRQALARVLVSLANALAVPEQRETVSA